MHLRYDVRTSLLIFEMQIEIPMYLLPLDSELIRIQ